MANHLSFNVLNSLVEGRAQALDEARARRHLASCPRCRSELEWLGRIRGQPKGARDAGFGVVDSIPRTHQDRADSQGPDGPQDGPRAMRRGHAASGMISRDWLAHFQT